MEPAVGKGGINGPYRGWHKILSRGVEGRCSRGSNERWSQSEIVSTEGRGPFKKGNLG